MPASGFPKPVFRHFRANEDRMHETAERDIKIWQARIRGRTIQQIAQDLGCTTKVVRDSIARTAQNIRMENAPELVKAEVDRIDILLQNAIEVLEKTHYATSHGKVLLDPTKDEPTPLEDSAPVLKAIDTIIKLMERRSKLLGLDAPNRTEAAVTLTQTTQEDLALMDLINQTRAQMALGLNKLTASNDKPNT